MQRNKRRLDSHGSLMVQPNPFMDEIGIEAVTQGDAASWAPLLNRTTHTWVIRREGGNDAPVPSPRIEMFAS